MNIKELAEFFPANTPAEQAPQKVIGVPNLQPGETLEQAIQRRAEVTARINCKNAERAA